MARKPRQLSSLNLYHVVIRGADRQIIFENDRDYRKYLQYLEYYKEKCDFELYAYCLMSNHVHLLIHNPSSSLDSIFRHINTAYSIWFNMKYQRTGHLQQGRFYSEPIESLQQLMSCMRYIHHNPAKAGFVSYDFPSYKWSSFNDYFSKSPLADTDFILNLFANMDDFLNYHKTYSSNDFVDIDKMIKRMPDDVAKEIITSISGCQTSTDFQKLSLLERNRVILELKKKGLSIRQINRLTGVSRGVIQRI